MINLRIRRTFSWVSAPFTNQTPIGGPIDLHLESTDVLEQWVEEAPGIVPGNWVPVPIVEEARPEHPSVARHREAAERMTKAFTDGIANMTPQQKRESDAFLARLGIQDHKP